MTVAILVIASVSLLFLATVAGALNRIAAAIEAQTVRYLGQDESEPDG